MQKAAAHRLRPDALLPRRLAALQESAAAPNVAVLDEQPEDQAAPQPPPDWTLPGDSVQRQPGSHCSEWSAPARTTLPGANHSEQGSSDWLPPPPPRPAEPASATPANNMSAGVGPVGSAPPLMRQRLKVGLMLRCWMHQAIFCCQTAFETTTAIWT